MDLFRFVLYHSRIANAHERNGILWQGRVIVWAFRYRTCYAANGHRAATGLSRFSGQADGFRCSATLGGCDLGHPIGDGDGAAAS